MIKELIGLRLRAILSSMTGRSRSGEYKKPSIAKMILFAVLYIYVAVAAVFLSAMFAFSFGMAILPIGERELYFAIISAAVFLLVFILSIFETKSELFDCKDNDTLFSMPIPTGSILIARISVVLISNYLITALLVIPSAIVYLVLTADAAGFLGFLFTSLLAPLGATAIASAAGYLFAIISKRIRHNTLVTSVAVLAFLGLYFYVYFNIFAMQDPSGAPDFAPVISKLAFLKPLGAASTFAPLPLVIYTAVCLGVAYLSYRIISARYLSVITASHKAKRSEYRAARMKRGGAMLAVMKKDITKLFGSTVYLTNGALALFFELALAGFVLIKGSEVSMRVATALDQLGFAADLSTVIAIILFVVMSFLSSMLMISSCSLSLEGGSLWVLRSTPIAASSVLFGKTAAQCIVALPVAALCALIASISLGLSPLVCILLIISILLMNLVYALIGTVINVMFPKFEFENEAQPIKQSVSTLITMALTAAISLALAALGLLFLTLGLGVLYFAAVSLLLALAAVGLIIAVKYPCARRFDGFAA